MTRMFFHSYKRFGEYVFATNEYGCYCIPASAAHRPASVCVMSGEVWERRTVEFMLENCRGEDVITAGAFFGDNLPALSKVCKRVWSFEPNPENYRCAQMTVLLNDLRNVKLSQAGLGEKYEKKELVVKDHLGRSLGGGSQIANITDRGSEGVSVNLVTIDSMVDEHANIAIVHLDVEGFEEYALRGAKKTIERCRPLLILETIPQNLEGYRVERQLDEQTYLLTPNRAEFCGAAHQNQP